tara:strand:+ start:517 stop:669 length:153 start_codon:yes stop_codon:yes gene_type:complete
MWNTLFAFTRFIKRGAGVGQMSVSPETGAPRQNPAGQCRAKSVLIYYQEV